MCFKSNLGLFVSITAVTVEKWLGQMLAFVVYLSEITRTHVINKHQT